MTQQELAQIIRIQSRVDVLENIVQILAVRAGGDSAKLRETMDLLHESCWQKRLEEVERLDPALAAELGRSTDFSKVDLDLLDGLFFGGDKPKN